MVDPFIGEGLTYTRGSGFPGDGPLTSNPMVTLDGQQIPYVLEGTGSTRPGGTAVVITH